MEVEILQNTIGPTIEDLLREGHQEEKLMAETL